jgi:hypothetical protein
MSRKKQALRPLCIERYQYVRKSQGDRNIRDVRDEILRGLNDYLHGKPEEFDNIGCENSNNYRLINRWKLELGEKKRIIMTFYFNDKGRSLGVLLTYPKAFSKKMRLIKTELKDVGLERTVGRI